MNMNIRGPAMYAHTVLDALDVHRERMAFENSGDAVALQYMTYGMVVAQLCPDQPELAEQIRHRVIESWDGPYLLYRQAFKVGFISTEEAP